MLGFTSRVTTFRSNGQFQNGYFYYTKKFFISPKIDDWVSYELKEPEKCRGLHIGKIASVELNKSYVIYKENISPCDSAILGPIKTKIGGIVYPQHELTKVSKLFLLFPFRKPAPMVEPKQLSHTKSGTQYYIVNAKLLSPDEKELKGEREYFVIQKVNEDRSKISMNVYLGYGEGRGFNYDLIWNRLPNSNSYELEANSQFSGKYDLLGDDLEGDGQRFDVTLKTGEKFRGVNFFVQTGMRSQKMVFNKEGRPIFNIYEEARLISEQENVEKMKAQVSAPPKKSGRGYSYF